MQAIMSIKGDVGGGARLAIGGAATIVATFRNLERGSRRIGFDLQPTKAELAKIAVDDNANKIVRQSVDTGGTALIPLAKSTRKNRRRGGGPPLAPRGMNSRMVKNFRAYWTRGPNGQPTLEARYFNVPFAQYHLLGTKHIPKRDVSGYSLPSYTATSSVLALFLHDYTLAVLKHSVRQRFAKAGLKMPAELEAL